ncbi:MAG: glycosyltransferase family 4 protein [Balneolaceae bacterium]
MKSALKDRKRVIFTVNYSPWSPYSGGGQRSTHYLASAMAEKGHDVHVIYSKSPLETIGVPADLPYRVHWATLYSFRSRREIFLRPLTAFPVNRIVERLCRSSPVPVVVHAGGEEAAQLYRIRDRLSFILIATPRYSGYPGVIKSWHSLGFAGKAGALLRHWKYYAQGAVLRQADRVCPPSRWAAGMVAQTYAVDPENVQAVPNGVPPEFLSYRKKEYAASGGILFFGRLSKDKGVDLLLQAYKQLGEPKPDLFIAGRGEEKKQLVRLCSACGIEKKVNFLPWLSHDELGGHLMSARLCILPSRVENYSLAVLSALAVGVPTISTTAGGTPEIIRHGETGYLVEPGHCGELASAIRELLQKPSLAGKLGRSGADFVRGNNTWDRIAGDYEKIYNEELLAAGKRIKTRQTGRSSYARG